MSTVQPGGGSMVRRILLGSQLRRLREAKGISREAAGYHIRASESKISRMELGRVGFKERDVADLLTLYGVTEGPERDSLLDLARGAHRAGWWHHYSDVLPGWFQTYVGLEESAALIRTYEVQFVPGLLQCPEYIRAVTTLGRRPATDEEVERRIRLRMRRQELLLAEGGPEYHAVIDEAALRRPLGGASVMQAQIRHLLDLAARPNITIQLMPLRHGGHAAEGGPFTILRFPGQKPPDVVYLEQLTGALYLDKHNDVHQYQQVMDLLCQESQTPRETAESLRAMLKELD